MLPSFNRVPEIWKPRFTKRVFCSEILNKWMAIQVTPRTMDLIDESYGFDNYILKVIAHFYNRLNLLYQPV